MFQSGGDIGRIPGGIRWFTLERSGERMVVFSVSMTFFHSFAEVLVIQLRTLAIVFPSSSKKFG